MGKGLFFLTLGLILQYSRVMSQGPWKLPTNFGEVQTSMTSGFVDLNSNTTKSAIDLVPKGSNMYGKLELEEMSSVTCRPGFRLNIGRNEYIEKMKDCRNRLEKASNGTSETLECVRICAWNEFNYTIKGTEDFNRAAYETAPHFIQNFPGTEGNAARKAMADDFEYCWQQYRPRVKYDRSGCVRNLPFSKCWKERSDMSCKGRWLPPPAVDPKLVPPPEQTAFKPIDLVPVSLTPGAAPPAVPAPAAG